MAERLSIEARTAALASLAALTPAMSRPAELIRASPQIEASTTNAATNFPLFIRFIVSRPTLTAGFP